MRVTDEMVNKALDTLIEYGVLSMDTSIESDTAAARAALEAALSHAAWQEGDDSLPRPLWPVSKEWYRLCERRFAVDRITISGKLAEAIVDAVCGPAIAAQRKEGE